MMHLQVGKQLVELLALGSRSHYARSRRHGASCAVDDRAELVPTRDAWTYMTSPVRATWSSPSSVYASPMGPATTRLPRWETLPAVLKSRGSASRLDPSGDHQRPGQPRPRRESKNLDREELVAEVHRRRLAGQKVVFTNGCFDILHPGHVRCFARLPTWEITWSSV